MPVFVWTAKDKSGHTAVREMHAETAAEARQMLVAEGYTDLMLREDEIAAATREGMPESTEFLGQPIRVSAEDRLKHRGQPPPTFFRVFVQSIPKGRLLYPLLLVMLAVSIYRGQIVTAVVIGVAMLAWPIFVTWISLPSIYFARLHKASDWSRWDEVLALVDKLERLNRMHFIKIPAAELGRNRAKAMVGKGQVAQALDYYRQFENQPGCPSWLYKAHVAGLYTSAKDYDKALEWNVKAIAEQPSTALYIDLLNRLVRYKRDTSAAHAALAKIDSGTVPDAGKSFVARSRGILAYLEGDNAAARSELESALSTLEAARNQPFRDGNMALTKAYLSCVLARQGQTADARKYLAEAREYLVATNETELLAECERMTA